ncbi:Uncharacterised protein [Klebsiella pneumoniae]|nr:Uncharacterised protein [Klebsiella pneumoniae]
MRRNIAETNLHANQYADNLCDNCAWAEER